MKWLLHRYAYPLVTFIITLSFVLQFAWLYQLFLVRRCEAIAGLEQIVGKSAQLNTYLSLAPDNAADTNIKSFFLSPEWLQIREAYNNMRFKGFGSYFNNEVRVDSTFVELRFRIANIQPAKKQLRGYAVRPENGPTLAEEEKLDHKDFIRMDSVIDTRLNRLGVKLKHTYVHYDFDQRRRITGASPEIIKQADFSSQQYSYNLRFMGMYQLIIPSVNALVFYDMRYYLLSSVVMILLTVAVFIFLLRLVHQQHLYAKATLSFTSNMTHELKTPVATVAIAIETIMENHLENDPDTLRKFLNIGTAELKRLNLMIDKVLDLEQLDTDYARLRSELFDVRQGLEQVVYSMQLQIKNSAAEIYWAPADSLCFIKGDTEHLTNVFINLIENALKYGGKGVKLSLSCQRESNEVVISVKDNGPGIAPIFQNRVFERFFRVPAENTDIHTINGSGLGLHYVKQIIAKHHGRIELVSELHHGCNFIINLPIAS